jgi:hypothetical protein
MWGAFGNTPSDGPPRPPALTAEAAKAAAAEEEAKRTLATDFDPKDPGPSQFVPPVHGVKVSNDGLVYVADRGGKRVQVFTTDGKYITQVWIDRWCLAVGGGAITVARPPAWLFRLTQDSVSCTLPAGALLAYGYSTARRCNLWTHSGGRVSRSVNLTCCIT